MKDQRKTKAQLIEELEALRQSEERYRQLFESANDAIISLTLDGIITTTNRGAEVLLGWSREERVGRHYSEFLTPASVTFTAERARRIQAGEKVPSIYEIEVVRKDGSVVPVEARSRFIRDREERPVGILVAHRDITARKRAEATIIEWKNRYEAAIQASGQVLYDWDPFTNKMIWGVNVEQLFGYCPEEMPGDLVGTIELIHPNDREAFQQEIDRVIATKESFRLEYRIRRKNGECATVEDRGYFFRDSAGNLVRMVGFLVDITERKRAGEALREGEEKFRAQYRGIPIPTYTWRRLGEEFVLIDYNDAATAITGGRIIDFLGKSAREMYQDQPEILEEFTRCFVDRSTSTEEMFYQLKTTGESKHFAVSYTFVPPDLVMIHTEDTTERKRVEEALRESEEQFRSLIEYGSDLIAVLTGEGILRYVSPSHERVLGYVPEELIGKDAFALVHPDDLPGLLETFASGIHTPGSTVSVKFRFRHKDGSWHAFESTGQNLLDHPAVRGVIVNSRDISERRRAEEALQKSEQRYRIISEMISDYAYAVQIEPDWTYTIEWFTETFTRVTGFTLEKGPHSPGAWKILIHPDDMSIGRERVQKLISGQADVSEFRIITKSGEVRWVHEYGCPVWDETQGRVTHLYIAGRDITDRKRMEESLRDSEQRYRGLVESQQDLIVRVDPQGRFTFVNDAYCKKFAKQREELIGTSFMPLVHEDDQAATLETMKELAVPLHRVVLEQRVLTAEGWRWVTWEGYAIQDEHGRTMEIQAVGRDITARKRAEEALRQSEERYRNLFENANDAIVVVDLNRTVVSINRAMEQLLGWSREELIGQNNYKVLTPAGIALSEERERRIQNGERVPSIFEHEFVRKDGGKVLVEGRTRFIRDRMGKPIGFQGIYRDITARKQAEEERQQLQRQLFQAQKLESVGTLAGGIAHDFNNILAAILGFTELVADEVPDGTRARRNLEEVLKASRRAKGLVQQLLTFSRPHNQGYRPIHLQPIVEEVLTFLRALPTKTIAIHPSIDTLLAPVLADPTQIQQVLTNLCMNAVQAMEEKGGVLEVSLTRAEVDGASASLLHNLKPGPHVRLTVRDTGYGMTAEVMQRIFDPFFTTKSVGQGNGLGLSIVHRIVTNHGGAITVESQPGQGTTFHVYLPLSENIALSENISHQSSSPAGTSPGNEKGTPSDATHFGH